MADPLPSPSAPWPLRAFGVDPRLLTPLEKIALSVGLLLSFVVFLVSLMDVGQYAGIDFRNRIVGARVMLTGQDPYTFAWQPGMPLELLDPSHDDKVHRLTAPPPTLFLYALIAPLPYKVERLLSCFFEWLALIASVSILSRTIPDHRQRVLFLLAAMFFFILSNFWRIHVERGQVYVFHLLLLSAGASVSLRHNLNSWTGGILFGLATLMRPNYLLIAPAFLIMRKWKTGLGTALTFVLGALATLPLMHPDSWQSYLRLGDQYYLTLWNPERLPARPPPNYQGLVEGVDFSKFLEETSSSSFAVLYQTWQEKGWLPIADLGLVSKGILVALAVALFGLLLRKRPHSTRHALGLILVFALATDLFLPHRWSYVDVMLLLPLGFLWPFLWENRTASHVALAALLVAFAGSVCLTPHLTLYYGNLLRAWLVLGSLMGLGIVWWLKNPEPV
jgi:hypothetical protein